ncbi:MAG: ABC transporter substrate-binding protein [Candidatus Paceibacterota bacterium]|jgi:peptide/nickel transport system substrate-binding protein
MIYSGIIEENGRGGFENNLAEDIIVNESRTVYEIYLRDNVYFHDGIKLTADDVIFTINTLKNYDYKSPYFSLFKDTKVEKLGELMLKITVPVSQSNFYNYLGFKIVPKHLWESVTPDQFSVHELNIKPIGSGPYMVSKVEKNKAGNIINIALKRNKRYFKNAFIEKINIRFFANSEDAFAAFVKGNIDMIKELTPYQKDLIHKKNRIQLNHLKLPRYYAIFLNQKNSLLANRKLNEILDMAVNKQAIIETVFFGDAELLNAPIASNFIGYYKDLNKNIYNLELAKSKLKDLGYVDKDGDGILEK